LLALYLSLIETNEDRDKIEKIYHRYKKLMKYIAMQILGREELAEDAVHDAMVRLIENLSSIKEEGSKEEKAFVAIVTENVARDLWRKERYRRSEDITDYLHVIPSRGSVVEKVYVNELLERICALPETLRAPLEMSIYLGLSSKEIARTLNITEEAVRKRIQRGREYLSKEEALS